MSIPLARSMIEGISFTPIDAGRCTLTWQVHLDPAPVLVPVESRFVAAMLTPMFEAFAAGLADYAAAHPG